MGDQRALANRNDAVDPHAWRLVPARAAMVSCEIVQHVVEHERRRRTNVPLGEEQCRKATSSNPVTEGPLIRIIEGDNPVRA